MDNPIRVSIFKSAKQSQAKNDVPLDAFFKGIRSGRWQKPIARLRAIEDAAEKKKAKASILPGITPSALFSGHTRTKGNEGVQHTGVVNFDFDGLSDRDPAPDIMGLCGALAARSDLLGYYVSASGDGVAAFFLIAPVPSLPLDRLIQQHSAAYQALYGALEPLAQQHGFKLDALADHTRLRFVSSDPQAFYRMGASQLKPFTDWAVPAPAPASEGTAPSAPPPPAAPANPANNHPPLTIQQIEDFLRQQDAECATGLKAGQSQRQAWMGRVLAIVGACQEAGVSQAEGRRIALDWSKTAKNFLGEKDFEGLFDTKGVQIPDSGAPLVDWAKRVGYDLYAGLRKAKGRGRRPAKEVNPSELTTDPAKKAAVEAAVTAGPETLPVAAPVDWELPFLSVDEEAAKGMAALVSTSDRLPGWVLSPEIAPRSPEAVALCLRLLQVGLRYNVRHEAVEVNVRGLGWAKLDDRRRVALREAVAGHFWFFPTLDDGSRGARPKPLYIPSPVFNESILAWTAYGRRAVDDVRVWLESLRGTWDGHPRIAAVLSDLFGADRTEMNDAASMSIFLGIVRMTFKPASLTRGIPVLVGPQDTGKSTFIHKLLPAAIRQYSNPGLSLHGDDKQRTEGLLGMAVVEISEMAGASRVEIEQLKAWMTKRSDPIRLAYRHDPTNIPRRAMMIATMNEGQRLPFDPTGSSRWIVVDCPGGADMDEMITDAVRDQWFAEAVDRMTGPENLLASWGDGLPYRLREQLETHNERHKGGDEPFANAIAALDYDAGDFDTLIGWAQQAKVLYDTVENRMLDSFPNKRDQMTFANELVAAGFTKQSKRIGGTFRRGWKAPIA